MPDFPRGWTLSQILFGAGGPAAVAQPAVPGVAHVVDSISYKVTSAAAAAKVVAVGLFFGGTQVWTGFLSLAGAPPQSTDSLQVDIGMTAPINTTVTLTGTSGANPATDSQGCQIWGHSI